MHWKQKIQQWKNGTPQRYPNNLTQPFMWNTNNSVNAIYDEEYLECPSLPLHQDYSPFQKFINESNDTNVVSFHNLSKDTILVVPMPRKNKNFATLKHFVDNASHQQQVAFWKHVAQLLESSVDDGYYVSVHGHGVAYLHVRISRKPKYHFAKQLY